MFHRIRVIHRNCRVISKRTMTHSNSGSELEPELESKLKSESEYLICDKLLNFSTAMLLIRSGESLPEVCAGPDPLPDKPAHF